ncbi:MAG: hypothetical protein J3Q66DRAFT_344654 [Benniella sp.]|nr:MAG: hypothetical protein J3Q66DRAFT_344654 [Benniella sp.]
MVESCALTCFVLTKFVAPCECSSSLVTDRFSRLSFSFTSLHSHGIHLIMSMRVDRRMRPCVRCYRLSHPSTSPPL